MSLKVEVEGDVAVITIDGDVTMSESSDLQAMISRVQADGICRIVFDLEHLKYISSLGIGVLARVCGELKKINGKMVVYNPSEDVHKLFKLLRLDRIIPIVSSRGEAIELCS
jgi:anti-sigma B factor antagonist